MYTAFEIDLFNEQVWKDMDAGEKQLEWWGRGDLSPSLHLCAFPVLPNELIRIEQNAVPEISSTFSFLPLDHLNHFSRVCSI